MRLFFFGLVLTALLGCDQDDRCAGYCVARGFDGGTCPTDFCFGTDTPLRKGETCRCNVPAGHELYDGVVCTQATVDIHSAFPDTDEEVLAEDPATVKGTSP